MLWIGKNRVGIINIGRHRVSVMYKGAVKIYEAVSSCFGSGWWRPLLPWRGGDSWKY